MSVLARTAGEMIMMKRLVRFAAIILVVTAVPTLASTVPTHQSRSKPISAILDGKKLPVSPSPVMKNGRIFVPAEIFRPIGLRVVSNGPQEAEVGWPESDFIINFKA